MGFYNILWILLLSRSSLAGGAVRAGGIVPGFGGLAGRNSALKAPFSRFVNSGYRTGRLAAR
ncbi:MAG: hypothetical protein CMJ73_01215 [Planctomycetaceae bacterium]|nr:hypothetical protein [Planctomycetaceae bacterium]